MAKSNKVIEADNVVKYFKVGSGFVGVLYNISFEIEKGEFVIIFGPSGCGKSTLLHILLGLEPVSDGNANILGYDMSKNLDEDDAAIFRNKHVGIVYQQSYWINSMSVMDNVAFPLYLRGLSEDRALEMAEEVIDMVDMISWKNYIPTELSSGQQQRIALARAIINDPKILVADEPTGNLDYDSGKEIMELLKGMNEKDNKTIIMVTHDLEYLTYADRALRMVDGKIVEDFQGENMQEQIHDVIFKKNGNGDE